MPTSTPSWCSYVLLTALICCPWSASAQQHGTDWCRDGRGPGCPTYSGASPTASSSYEQQESERRRRVEENLRAIETQRRVDADRQRQLERDRQSFRNFANQQQRSRDERIRAWGRAINLIHAPVDAEQEEDE